MHDEHHLTMKEWDDISAAQKPTDISFLIQTIHNLEKSNWFCMYKVC